MSSCAEMTQWFKALVAKSDYLRPNPGTWKESTQM